MRNVGRGLGKLALAWCEMLCQDVSNISHCFTSCICICSSRHRAVQAVCCSISRCLTRHTASRRRRCPTVRGAFIATMSGEQSWRRHHMFCSSTHLAALLCCVMVSSAFSTVRDGGGKARRPCTESQQKPRCCQRGGPAAGETPARIAWNATACAPTQLLGPV
jgi:hypothetical protein